MIIKKQEQEELNTHPWRYECKSFIIDSISLSYISFSYTIQQVDDSIIFTIIQTTANNRQILSHACLSSNKVERIKQLIHTTTSIEAISQYNIDDPFITYGIEMFRV